MVALIKITVLAVLLMFLGAWYLSFASRMMRSNNLAGYRQALRPNIFSIAAFWCAYVPALIWPGMEDFSAKMGVTLALAIGLLLVFRLVKDVTLTKKVVIWFVWHALNICTVIVYFSLPCPPWGICPV